MHRIRVYVDTSVFGGVDDEEFRDASYLFFENVEKGTFTILLSRLTTDELEDAPERIREVLERIPRELVEQAPINDEVLELADEYVKAGVLGEASRDDATHVAAATVAGAGLIVSWNFRHIVNYNRILGFNAVNTRNGYRPLMILSPREALDDEQGF